MRSTTSVCTTASVLWLVMCIPALAQDGLPYDIMEPSPENGWWASGMASGWDVNHDGCDDLFLVDALHENALGQPVGEWSMYSGADGALLWVTEGTIINPHDDEGFDQGMFGTFIGDIDDDDIPDLVVGAPGATYWKGYVALVSGASGEVIGLWEGSNDYQLMGRDVAAAGDVNNDGVPDFAYVSDYGSYWVDGTVVIRSGSDFAVLHEWAVPFPRRIRWAGDINNDHYDDIVIGSWNGNWRPEDRTVKVFSGKPGQGVILELHADPENDHDFGYALAAGTDVTGDGVPDIAVDCVSYRLVSLYSGATGEVVSQFSHEYYENLFGKYLCFADVNGDTRSELVIAGTFLVEVFDPINSTVLFSLPSHMAIARYQFGNEHTVGDFNGDGCADIVPDHIDWPRNHRRGIALWGGGRLLLSTPCMEDLRLGQSCVFNVYGDSPGRTVYLFASKSGCGCTFVDRLGMCIDLDSPLRLKGSAETGPDRWASMRVSLPRDAEYGDRWLQAIDPNHPKHGPIKSNVWRMR